MNHYIKELASICKLPFNEVVKDFKVIQLADRVIYISNYYKILDYNTDRLLVKVKNNILEITGSNLTISQINKKEIIIKGKIITCSLGVVHETK